MINYETVSALATTADLKRECTCDRHLRNVHIQVERKRLTFDLKENLRGKFLRGSPKRLILDAATQSSSPRQALNFFGTY
jgi:hypothetical protein